MSSSGNNYQVPQTSQRLLFSTGGSAGNNTTPSPPPGYIWGELVTADNKETIWRKCLVFSGGCQGNKPTLTVATSDGKGDLPGEPEVALLDSELGWLRIFWTNSENGHPLTVTVHLTRPMGSADDYQKTCIDLRADS